MADVISQSVKVYFLLTEKYPNSSNAGFHKKSFQQFFCSFYTLLFCRNTFIAIRDTFQKNSTDLFPNLLFYTCVYIKFLRNVSDYDLLHHFFNLTILKTFQSI